MMYIRNIYIIYTLFPNNIRALMQFWLLLDLTFLYDVSYSMWTLTLDLIIAEQCFVGIKWWVANNGSVKAIKFLHVVWD